MSARVEIQFSGSDLSLLERYIATSDAEVFAEIVRRHSGVVYSACRRVLNDDARAQEVSQETFFRLLRQPKLVTQSLGGWLHRSATHLAIDARRSDVSRRDREQSYCADRKVPAEGQETKWSDMSPLIDEAIEELPEPARSLLTRHFLQSVSQAELAEEMNLSAATVSRRMKSATEELRRHLRDKGIYVGVLALMEFCKTQTVHAAPARLAAELTKMALVGPIDLSPAPAVGPAVYRPGPFEVREWPGDSRLCLIGSFIGAAGLIALLSIFAFWWMPGGTNSAMKNIEPGGSPPPRISR